MLISTRKDTNERIEASRACKDTIKQLALKAVLVCPECSNIVYFKCGNIYTPHFAHVKGANCNYKYFEPETEEHRQGKLLLRELLAKEYPEATVMLEEKIPETNQRSDVLVIHPNGERWAFEFQCSMISGDTLRERHYLYSTANVKDIWIVGFSKWAYGDHKKRHVRDLHRALLDIFGHVLFLDPASKKLHVVFHGLVKKNTLKYSIADELLAEEIRFIDGVVNSTKYLEHLQNPQRLGEELKHEIKDEKELRESNILKRERSKQLKVTQSIEKILKKVTYETKYCPICANGKLKLINGPYSIFIGCSSYPKCKFSATYKEVLEPHHTCIKCYSIMKMGYSKDAEKFFWRCLGCRNICWIEMNVDEPSTFLNRL